MIIFQHLTRSSEPRRIFLCSRANLKNRKIVEASRDIEAEIEIVECEIFNHVVGITSVLAVLG